MFSICQSIAYAYSALSRFAEAERDSSSGLLLQPNHVKALYRRGIARKQLGKLTEARADLTLALGLSPQDSGIKAELDAVRLEEAQQQSIPKVSCPIHYRDFPFPLAVSVHQFH